MVMIIKKQPEILNEYELIEHISEIIMEDFSFDSIEIDFVKYSIVAIKKDCGLMQYYFRFDVFKYEYPYLLNKANVDKILCRYYEEMTKWLCEIKNMDSKIFNTIAHKQITQFKEVIR